MVIVEVKTIDSLHKLQSFCLTYTWKFIHGLFYAFRNSRPSQLDIELSEMTRVSFSTAGVHFIDAVFISPKVLSRNFPTAMLLTENAS